VSACTRPDANAPARRRRESVDALLSPRSAHPAMELTYSEYEARQRQELSMGGLEARAEKLIPAGKFDFRGGSWQPAPYCGYAVVTMVDDRPEHGPLLETVERIQEQLARIMAEPGSLFPLPVPAFTRRSPTRCPPSGTASMWWRRDWRATTLPGLPPRSAIFRLRAVVRRWSCRCEGWRSSARPLDSWERLRRRTNSTESSASAIGSTVRQQSPNSGFGGPGPSSATSRSRTSNAPWRSTRGGDWPVQWTASTKRSVPSRRVFHLERAELRAYSHLAEFHALAALPVVRL
jgi:hypothetical protein